MSYDGLDLKKVFYLGATNEQYALRNGIDTFYTTNCAKDKRQLVSLTTPPETTIVMGHKCQTLIYDLGSAQNKYWFDSAIYLNPGNFKNHRFGYFNLYCEKAKSPYLKRIYNGANFSLTCSAVSNQKRKLSSILFLLPKFPKKGF